MDISINVYIYYDSNNRKVFRKKSVTIVRLKFLLPIILIAETVKIVTI